jgi:chromosome segregation ATPase
MSDIETSNGPFTAHWCDESRHYKDEADKLRALLGELDRSNESLSDQLATATRERDEARAELQHAVSENQEFNIKVAAEINMARMMRDSLESRLANWLEGNEDEPINAHMAASAVRSGAWRKEQG